MTEETEPPLITSAAFAEGLDRLAASGRLFVAIDGADASGVADKAREMGGRVAVCLYRAEEDPDLAAVAPYLFAVDGAALRWVRERLAEDPAFCIFVLADTNLEGLRRHFRRFLVVQSPAGTKMNFRFFDPRVLTTYLESCEPRELDDFYGPATEYGVPTEDGLGALFFKRREEGPPRRRSDVLLKLRPAQMRAFARATEERFVDRTATFLQMQFPDALEEPRPLLRVIVADQIARARGHGFTAELEIVTYVISAWVLGAKFDEEFPAVREKLASPVLTTGDKAAWLAEWTQTLLRTLQEK
ncbi:DUF4123 domain-containing protein [Polyangium aurulentum]|uniref:DUF4123 domain-containing protein n=1 Tax=Polyangium aurulentum TaxID=2567896 RepID=UPI0010AEE0C2|nr:DUF4123 domain-containing protein [Polyangium aurulentum]UQA55601.1 DUF4123 domain-containing protein [Polyangium aurulentum]